ncbi:MAG: glycoside hydrolase family 127 protein [Nitrososphaerota archaeon]|nr:glycoside hydrolase family 127 protein [Nitrososphaerota archaeon]
MSQKNVFVVDTSESPYALLRPVSITDVEINGGFWRKKLDIVFQNTLIAIYRKLEETDRINRFKWAAKGLPKQSDKTIFPFDDTDVYKWIEACAYKLAQTPDEDLEKLVRDIIPEIASAQEPDGYLFTELHGKRELRWKNLAFNHELYTAGHLIQAAIAWHRATRDLSLLNIASKFADLIVDTFKPGGIRGSCGHPNIEMALVELYRETGKKDYLDCALHLVEERGRSLIKTDENGEWLKIYTLFGGAEYFVDHVPFRELKEIAGHAVRALYLNCGVTDIYAETGDKELLETLNRLWNDVTSSKMYITGGIGSRYITESFGEPYELPNMRAYSETCAAIANFMWNWRMLMVTSNANFTDLMERTLYNGILAGISLDGTRFFYMNPLASRGQYARQEWFLCACCPPNIARLITSLPGYMYSVSKEGIWIHLYAMSKSTVKFNNINIQITQRTDYPWDGKIDIIIEPDQEEKFTVFLFIPGWCDNPIVRVDGKRLKAVPKSYLAINRVWRSPSKIEVRLPMQIERNLANPSLEENFGKVALSRGPLIYCFEEADNPGIDLWNTVMMEEGIKMLRLEQLDNVVALQARGMELKDDFIGELYLPLDKLKLKIKNVKLIAIPYYAWANRNKGSMRVWMPTIDILSRSARKREGAKLPKKG